MIVGRSVIMEVFDQEDNGRKEVLQRKQVFYGFRVLAFIVVFGLGTLTGYVARGEHTIIEEEPMKTEGKAISYPFYLGNDEGLITVYRTDTDEVYEYTNIVIENLPKNLQEEIQRKKYILNEEELYNFLESYTS